MSITADRLRALRKQAGDTTVREATGSAPLGNVPHVQPNEALEQSDARHVAQASSANAAHGALKSRARLDRRTASTASPQRAPGPDDVAAGRAQGAGRPPGLAQHTRSASSSENGSTSASGLQRRVIPAPDTARTRERSVLDWMDAPSTPAANEGGRRVVQPGSIDALRRLIATRERKPMASIGTAPLARVRGSLDRHLPGIELSPGLHLIEAFLPQTIPAAALSLAFAKRADAVVEPRHLLFFDTETTGLAGGTGTRAFMVGAADWMDCTLRGPGLRIRQLMISTMAAEGAMLRAFADWLSPHTVLCSYNGRSYDAPLLKTRYRLARLPEPITALDHVDLLHPTRRRYRGTWENCKLATIERQLLRIVREDDLPGSEAPAAWLTYLRGGSARNLRRVAQHNHQDVVTLALLMQRLVAAEAEDREVLPFEEMP